MFRPRLNLATGVALTAIVVALYSALWLTLAHQARRRVDGFVARERAEGLNLSFAEETIGGFPTRLEVRFGSMVADGVPHIPAGHLAAPMATAWARPWRLDSWRFTLPAGATFDTPHGAVALGRLKGTASAVLGPGATPGGVLANINIDDVSAKVADSASTIAAVTLSARVPPAEPQRHEEPLFSMTVQAHGVKLQDGIEPLGSWVDHVKLDATWRGPLPPGALAQALAAWRDDGGTIELQGIDLGWGPLSLAADGTLALDQAMQPLGAFSARILGVDSILDALIADGRIPQSQASLVRMGLSMMTQRGADGTPQLKTPVTIQDDALYLGPAKLLKLAHIDW